MAKTGIKDFTQGNITKQLITFASPLFLSNLLQVVYNMVDMMVVGKVLGKAGISAVSVGGDVVHFLTFIVMGFANASQVLIAKYIGRKEQEKIGRFVGTMAGSLILSAVILSVFGVLFRTGILRLMRTPEAAFDGASAYSFVSMVGLVFIYGYNIVSAILRGMGDSKHPFLFISISAVTNLILDIIFVVFLKLGAGGAALATVISQAVSFIACTVFLYRNRQGFSLHIRLSYFFRWDREMLGSLVRLGTPMAIKTASIQVSKMFVNSFINSYGVAVSAFAGIANKIGSVANLVSTAMNTAGSTMVGQNIAAKEFGRVRKILLRMLAITMVIAAVCSVLIALFPDQIFGLFTGAGDADVLAIAKGYVPIAILLFIGSSLRSVMNALINGSGNYKINFVTAILDGVVMRIGLALLFGLVIGMKHYGFWLGDAIAGFTPFIIGIIFYFTGLWKKSAEISKKIRRRS